MTLELTLKDGVQREVTRKFTLSAIVSNPALILFVSANVINVGNLGFNVVFSRWMGPEAFGDLALLLTIKLSILSVLNAVQFEMAGRIAALAQPVDRVIAGQEINRVSTKILLCTFALTILFALMAWGFVSEGFSGFSQIQTYAIFAISLPFMAPLSLVRGWSQGALSIKKIVLSGQVEMFVRFGGGALAWTCGAGLPGIALAIALSIVAGWYFARPDNGQQLDKNQQEVAAQAIQSNSIQTLSGSPLWKGIMIAALPWACLQFGQVLALDGDFLAAKMQLDSNQAGLSAVTVLVQRILFFGCFGLATALLPLAVALKTRPQVWAAIRPIVILLFGTCVPVIVVMLIAPDLFVKGLFGEQFLAVSPSLVYAAFSGTFFVIVYLVATFFLARSKSYFGYLVLALALFQFAILMLVPWVLPDADMHTVIKIKSLIQFATVLLVLGIAKYEFAKFCRA